MLVLNHYQTPLCYRGIISASRCLHGIPNFNLLFGVFPDCFILKRYSKRNHNWCVSRNVVTSSYNIFIRTDSRRVSFNTWRSNLQKLRHKFKWNIFYTSTRKLESVSMRDITRVRMVTFIPGILLNAESLL